MKTRKERYKENREIRKKLGIIRKRCSGCGCYIEGRHKVWCKKMICKCGVCGEEDVECEPLDEGWERRQCNAINRRLDNLLKIGKQREEMEK